MRLSVMLELYLLMGFAANYREICEYFLIVKVWSYFFLYFYLSDRNQCGYK